MGRVGKDDCSLRNIRLDTSPAHLPLQTANPAADLRIAFGLLHLFPKIFAAHLEP